ncbi:MAG TPA: toll/interleukin-1 receptor domain-containing protein, partial [Bryobacteraceae bacterium]|nr:toll/interleukin-1 receptor domain-containing protein [Bryobacteraceae bacterium]
MAKDKNGSPPRKLRAFISYSHVDRKYGAQAKALLEEVGIEAFLAHEDLHVSDEWRNCIIEELKRCDLFVPLLSANFLTSKWAPQEVGFIISRPEVVIAPISIDGTTPFGFISHVQSRRIVDSVITREL